MLSAVKRWPRLQWVLLAWGWPAGVRRLWGRPARSRAMRRRMNCWGWPPQMPYCWPVRTAKVRQASHQARLADGDGFSLELRGVGEEGVVLGRDQLTAGGLITPAAGLAHAARPPCRHATCAARWTMGLARAASIGLADWASRPSSGRCIGGRREAWGSADASGFASGMQWDRVESEGPSGTSLGLSLLLRRHVAGSDGP